MKSECTRAILVPLRLAEMRDELGFYVTWYNQFRVHQSLCGRTPKEVYDQIAALPILHETRGKNGVKLKLVVSRLERRKHLPIVRLEKAA